MFNDEQLQIKRAQQNAENKSIKGISKSFIKYKQSVKEPTEEELKFHDFVHNAVKRREETRQRKLKTKKEQALNAERKKIEDKKKGI